MRCCCAGRSSPPATPSGLGGGASDTVWRKPGPPAVGPSPRAERSLAALDYAGALTTLAGLRAPVDAFFDSVMVNADDPRLRANRLTLLGGLHRLMNRVADLSKLAA